MFGHCHDQVGILREGDVIFSNAAMLLRKSPKVFDFYLDPDISLVTNTEPELAESKQKSKCVIM